MYLKSTEHTLCIYCDFVLRSEWSLINIPGTMGVGPDKLLVVKRLMKFDVLRALPLSLLGTLCPRQHILFEYLGHLLSFRQAAGHLLSTKYKRKLFLLGGCIHCSTVP